MKINKEKNYSVLSGDIIGSSKLSPGERKKLLSVMKSVSDELISIYLDYIPLKIDIFSGDSWQILLTQPELSLRTALLFRSLLRSKMNIKGIDSRIFIGIGTIDTLPSKKVSQGTGSAFTSSGRGLKELKKYNMGFAFPSLPEESFFNILTESVDIIASNWTDKQCLAISGALQGFTQIEISENWEEGSVKQQTVQKHLNSGFFPHIEHLLDFIENNEKIQP